jgi:hypothetical protein
VHRQQLPPLPQHIDRSLASPRSNGGGGGGAGAGSGTLPTFGVDLAEQMARDNVEVPPIVIKLAGAIERYGLGSVGIYRVSGTVSKIAKLKEKLDKGAQSLCVCFARAAMD